MAVNRFEIEQKLIFAQLSENEKLLFREWEIKIDAELKKIKYKDLISGNPVANFFLDEFLGQNILRLLISVYEFNGWGVRVTSPNTRGYFPDPLNVQITLHIYSTIQLRSTAINYY